VNPAAYTAVDRAESERELAYAINCDAVRAMGEAAREMNAGVIHFSTDYVFDGKSTVPYLESDETAPMSVYGASKLAGECILAETGAAHIIFRTSWVYGATGKNFLQTILKAARERDRLRVVADQHGAPTWSRDLAHMTAYVMTQVERRSMGRDVVGGLAELGGVYHASGGGETTWFGFAQEAIARLGELESGAKLSEVTAITTQEYPTPAKRPTNSLLNCDKLAARFDWKMMDWRDSLREVLVEL
jgi:dTDP-4-dehydrorhamnose reductase